LLGVVEEGAVEIDGDEADVMARGIWHEGRNSASRYGLAVHGNLTKKDGSFIVY
jgi:hypothetical protein